MYWCCTVDSTNSCAPSATASVSERGQKKSELRVLFHDCRHLSDLQDIRLCYHIGRLVQERLEVGDFPPFPRLYMEASSLYRLKELRAYRKYVRNAQGDDYILEPGQDPPRHVFYETRQYHRDYCGSQELVKYQTSGMQFAEEEQLFGK